MKTEWRRKIPGYYRFSAYFGGRWVLIAAVHELGSGGVIVRMYRNPSTGRKIKTFKGARKILERMSKNDP